MNGFASLHPFAAGTVRRREARVAAVCVFPGRLRVCVRYNGKSQRCANVRKKYKIAIQQRDCDFERRRSEMDELSRFARK